VTPALLVDGRALSPAFASSGSAAYLRGMLPALAAEGWLDVRALVTDGADVPTGVEGVPVTRRAPEQLRYFEQQVRLPNDIERAGADLFHSPATDPPRRCAVPWVQTLLDLIPLAVDAPVFRLERRLWRGRARRIRDAAAVIAISRHTADEGITRIGLDPRRVEVIHLGVDDDFRPAPTQEPADPPYLLHVSNLAPHKGYREALAVLARLADAGLPHQLEFVGGAWASEAPRVRAAIAASGCADRVHLLGRVTRPKLVELYQRASLVMVTSRYEGFGLPALEAMATGTPVVAFDNSSLPEVIGDGGVLVADGDTAAFADAARALLGDDRRREHAVEAGLQRAAQFDWKRCAHEHRLVLEACLR
jgi:glycosyltransferase involved in cell wall biosynthesis